MKEIRKYFGSLAIIGGLIASLNFVHAQMWLEPTGVSNGQAYLNLHNSTNQVYAIWSTTDLLANWNVETEVWPTNQELMPFTVPTLERQNLFVRAEDWTGVDSDGDGIPDWWIWKYFGDLSENATNLDSQGNTLLDDYQNVVDPNVISFSLSFTNQYVNTSAVSGTITVLGGVPSYMAVLINDMNQADAVWQPYTSSNIVATLGSTNGAYTVFGGFAWFAARCDPNLAMGVGDFVFRCAATDHYQPCNQHGFPISHPVAGLRQSTVGEPDF